MWPFHRAGCGTKSPQDLDFLISVLLIIQLKVTGLFKMRKIPWIYPPSSI